jgi:acetylornithine deacetylase/succinyl-diaminopimelate desuccinylase-like protein
MLHEAIREARAGRGQAEADLFEELRIPSVSALPEHRADVRRNAEWLADRLDRLGLVTRITDVPGGRHPVLQADLQVNADAPWLTIYGHYDVQPPDPIDEWVAIDFQEALGAPMVISGLAQADSAVHSPNERFRLDNYHRGIEMLLHFMYGLT